MMLIINIIKLDILKKIHEFIFQSDYSFLEVFADESL